MAKFIAYIISLPKVWGDVRLRRTERLYPLSPRLQRIVIYNYIKKVNKNARDDSPAKNIKKLIMLGANRFLIC